MVNNKADTIEDYILQKLSEQGDGQVELNRTELADKINVQLPDEKFRRVGQSAAAAGLPEIRK